LSLLAAVGYSIWRHHHHKQQQNKAFSPAYGLEAGTKTSNSSPPVYNTPGQPDTRTQPSRSSDMRQVQTNPIYPPPREQLSSAYDGQAGEAEDR